MPRRLLVDGTNVMGSRPDGWWRDRPAAQRRLVQALGRLDEPVVAVFDGKPPPDLPSFPHVEVHFAPHADDLITDLAEPDDCVVTSDRALAARVRARGAGVTGAGGFRRRLVCTPSER